MSRYSHRRKVLATTAFPIPSQLNIQNYQQIISYDTVMPRGLFTTDDTNVMPSG